MKKVNRFTSRVTDERQLRAELGFLGGVDDGNGGGGEALGRSDDNRIRVEKTSVVARCGLRRDWHQGITPPSSWLVLRAGLNPARELVGALPWIDIAE